jgi:hypothetical protein
MGFGAGAPKPVFSAVGRGPAARIFGCFGAENGFFGDCFLL